MSYKDISTAPRDGSMVTLLVQVGEDLVDVHNCFYADRRWQTLREDGSKREPDEPSFPPAHRLVAWQE